MVVLITSHSLIVDTSSCFLDLSFLAIRSCRTNDFIPILQYPKKSLLYFYRYLFIHTKFFHIFLLHQTIIHSTLQISHLKVSASFRHQLMFDDTFWVWFGFFIAFMKMVQREWSLIFDYIYITTWSLTKHSWWYHWIIFYYN